MAMEDLTPLQRELAELIIDICRVEEYDPAEVIADAPLAGPDSYFGLDSLDVVEIAVAVQNCYNIPMGGREDNRRVFSSLAALAGTIEAER